MPDTSPRRRFIAGAVCPRCALMDKIVVDLDTDQRICISCGFREDRPGMPAAGSQAGPERKPAELSTRVSRAAARRVETPAQPITLIDPAKKRDRPKD
jgi:uncharacterized metal-binding protein (TIGR02443 family)